MRLSSFLEGFLQQKVPNWTRHRTEWTLDRADTWQQINPSSKEINSLAAAGDGGVLLTWTTPIINNQDPDRPVVAVQWWLAAVGWTVWHKQCSGLTLTSSDIFEVIIDCRETSVPLDTVLPRLRIYLAAQFFLCWMLTSRHSDFLEVNLKDLCVGFLAKTPDWTEDRGRMDRMVQSF